MEPKLAEAITRKLGSAPQDDRSVAGGDINRASTVTLADGRRVFVKTNPGAPHRMFTTEAKGLQWLAEAGAIPIVGVLAVCDEDGDEPPFLVLEHLEPGPRRRDFDEMLGRGLAELHRSGAPSFGLDHDNFIGRLPQYNERRDDWPTFYREMRLEPQLKMAVDQGLATSKMKRGFERLFKRLEEVCGPPEPPARLHGDLWGGNLHVDGEGRPCLIDPAVYGGHREMDLAMMDLFGGFGGRVLDAYDEAWPLSDGWQQRVSLYQLYPLMVHVNMFGGPYVGSVERALQRY